MTPDLDFWAVLIAFAISCIAARETSRRVRSWWRNRRTIPGLPYDGHGCMSGEEEDLFTLLDTCYPFTTADEPVYEKGMP